MLSAVRASPPARRAISSTSSSGTSAPIAAAPRRTTSPSSSSESASQLDDLAAGEQGRVDLEVRVLGRRPDQRQQPVLDRGQQRVLLRLVEAVDLVEEEDRPLPVAAEPVARPLHDAAHVVDPGRDGRELLEGGAGLDGDDAGERRLPDSGRPVEDERAQAVLLDRAAERRPVRRGRASGRPARRASAAGAAAGAARAPRCARGRHRRRGRTYRQYAQARGDARGLLGAGSRRLGCERLRALPEHGRAARAPEDRRRVGAPRRAALPDRAPVVGALAQARLERRRGRDRAPRRAARSRPRSGCSGAALSASSTRRRSSTCSSRCRRGSTRRSARCSATAAASTRPAGARSAA